MKTLLVPFRQLVERRLWPVALLLVAALAAVPVLLSSNGQAGGAAVSGGATGAEGPTQPIVSVADAARTDTERTVLGSRKDPFRPSIAARAGRPASTADTASAPAAKAEGGKAPAGGASPGSGSAAAPADGGTGTPASPVTPVPAPSKRVYEIYSLKVRFGPSVGPLAERALKRLTGLPGGRRPALLYLGLDEDHKTAVFLVDGTAAVQGDGRCEPTPDDCQTLRMRAGDTVFIDTANGKQFQLDLLKVHTRRTTDAIEAQAARLAEARGGRAVLRRNVGRVGSYRYSSRQGVVTRRSADGPQ